MVFVLVLVAVIVRTLAVPLSIIISRLNSYILMCRKKKEENERTNQPTNRAHLHKSNNSGVGERIAIVKEKA